MRMRCALPSSSSETGVFEAVGARSCARGPTVYVVTPTYRRATQAPDMVRLSQALMLAEVRIFWVVVEDAERTSTLCSWTVREKKGSRSGGWEAKAKIGLQ
ncbi:hypothetical protein HPB49_023862 [Dermacentor silvarum]|uniref:Uncharacterized protein n=1 Tax=Dermacentor silvarum TaxID=543639 RepID=A0ACB8CC25_DERSI|nr:hypothetical protein HPB49_023862 [Dermacentor silvarum]